MINLTRHQVFWTGLAVGAIAVIFLVLLLFLWLQPAPSVQTALSKLEANQQYQATEVAALETKVSENAERIVTISKTTVSTVIPSTPTALPNNSAIEVSKTDGCRISQERLGTAQATFCRFSPDGQKIATPANDGTLWVVSVQGNSFERVIDPAGRFDISGDVVWSPNGEYIAFRSGNGVGYYEFATGKLMYLSPDDKSDSNAVYDWPRWTQDGRLIITWYPHGQRNPGSPMV